MALQKKYFATDIEASGPVPGMYSMLSIGACVVGDRSKQFYREIMPITSDFVMDAMKVAVKGLHCLETVRRDPQYDRAHPRFDPSKVLEFMYDHCEDPRKVMRDLETWVLKHANRYQAVQVAAPIKFDGAFTDYYFHRFNEGRNPFGFGGEDMNSMWRGYTNNEYAHVRELECRGADLPHNALDDALIEATEMEQVLKHMRSRQTLRRKGP